MSATRRAVTVFGLGLVGAMLVAAAPIARGTAPAAGTPAIGRPSTVPAQPLAGRRFTVSFRVTRRGTGAPMTRGTMLCTPSVGGRMIRHTESFRSGIARVSFIVPANAAGRLLKVKVTIEAQQSATRVATFRVAETPTPSVSIDDAAIAEGNAGTSTLAFPVTLSAVATRAVSVGYAAVNGTAVAPSDFASANGTITFQPGETAKTVAITVVADAIVEPNETLTVNLSSPVNATLARSVATGTITNDDTAVPVTPGPYKGATRIGNYVFLDVLPNRTLTRFRVNDLPLRCGARLEIGGGEDLGDRVYPIGSNGRFTGTTSWTGSRAEGDMEWTRWDTRLTGTFTSPTSVTGTITVTSELNFKGTHYRCWSGTVGWTATKEG